ncbi:MAG: DUF3857 domain-containing protein [Balneolaceae bacterium]|nr:DUF3857 domain-containing protein [Balneolaceae bacterium]MBO6547720.1 DUF3857 domain-containing protein [Balneolaceae bacterium]MBO6648231.1 DUF3857 domain-containing protein [Balneolaceae bacterium]
MKTLFSVLFLLISVLGNAQTYKFGDVPREHLEMEVYEKDSSASAVVLFSKGEAELNYYNDRFYLTVYRHIRIKILTDEGLDEGEIALRFRDRGSNSPQRVSGIKAESYTLSESGEIIKESVGRRDRYEEEVSENVAEIKFNVPGLKKGTVFEYEYELTSNNPLDFPSWVFQDDIPVIWSEYTAKIPEWFNFLTVSRGFHEFLVNEQERYNDRINFNSRNGVAFLDFEGTEYHYVMKDIPAIADEPYMKASMDYLSHIRFQLSSIQFPQTLMETYLDSWVELVNILVKDEDYGRRLRSSSELDMGLVQALEGAETEMDKMVGIYNHVSNHMEWNEEHGLYAFDDLAKVYEEGTGNGTAINLIMVQMLREAGFEAHPVALSTRFNGEIVNLFPLAGQFNHTIAYVQFDDSYFLLDAKNELRPYNLLPSEVLNGQGLIIYEGQEIWVPLQNQVPNTSRNVVRIIVDDEGYKGEVTSQNQGFYAVDLRNSFDLMELKESVNDEVFALEDPRFSVDSVSITNDQLDESFEFKTQFSFSDTSASDILYLDPMMMGKLKESPFEKKERTFPVDYNYPFTESIIMNIQIPEGWVVDEIPESVLIRLPEQAGEFRRIVQNNGNMISMNYRYMINKTRFMPLEYEGLKQFYDQMVDKLAQNIVLKKSS